MQSRRQRRSNTNHRHLFQGSRKVHTKLTKEDGTKEQTLKTRIPQWLDAQANPKK